LRDFEHAPDFIRKRERCFVGPAKSLLRHLETT
jgi:hypothetical protein